MNRLFPWAVALIAVFAVFIDIPKHQFSFPFNCPGICLRVGGFSVNQEIKTHLGLDLQGGIQLVLQMKTDEIPAGQSVPDYNERARRVIDRRINGLGVSEPTCSRPMTSRRGRPSSRSKSPTRTLPGPSSPCSRRSPAST